MKFTKLFEPIKIGEVEIPNRVALIPLNIHFSECNGFTGDEYTCFFTARARGGTGLLFYGAVLASQRAAEQQGLLIPYFYDVSHLHGMGNLTEAVHSFGSKIFIQLSPGFGRQQRHSRKPGWAPSIVQLDKSIYFGNRAHVSQKFAKVHPEWLPSIVVREMTEEDIQKDIEEFVMGAELAIFAGFDGIEIHTAHGYLVHQFFSPRTNLRTDKYGGPLVNRCRYMTELLDALRKKLGPHIPLLVRLSGSEHLPGGLTEEDMREIAKIAVAHGVDAIDLTDGTNESQKWFTPERDHVHILEEQGKKLKAAIGGRPIISQSIHNPYLAEQAVANGDTDFIGLGRQLMCDPEWANKVREGRIKDIVRCNRDNYCYVYMYREVGARCSRNKDFGKEKYNPANYPTMSAECERVPWLVPCGYGCPANIDATRYVNLIRKGQFAEAAAVVREKVPFPGVLGHVCPGLCENECQRGIMDIGEPIAIRALKRFAVEHDTGLWKANSKNAAPTGKKVAVVGSGPAGLTAAYYLAKKGHGVTVFEAASAAGGMMRLGIPDYRLPKAQLDSEIEEIKSVGVEIKLNKKVSSVDSLMKQGFDAAFLALGAQKGTALNIEGKDSTGVIDGVEFLRKVNFGEKANLKGDVAVIGTGHLAIDSARCAVRLGAKKVTVIHRRSPPKMPAYAEEIKSAFDEGVEVVYLAAPVKISKDSGRLSLTCVRTQPSDKEGSSQTEQVKGSEFTVTCDTIINATGQEPDITAKFGPALTGSNMIKVDAETLATSIPGVYAGGEVANGRDTVIDAIAAGRKAATSIDKFLGGTGEIDEVLVDPIKTSPYAGADQNEPGGFDDDHRISLSQLPVAQRQNNFNLVEQSMTEEQAVAQAKRCVRCDARVPETLRRMIYGR